MRFHPDLSLLKDIFTSYSEIQAVYLFGSVASRKIHMESDLDLAVYPGTDRIQKKKLQILTDLAMHGFCDVDLVFLDGRDIVMDYEAVRQNKIVFVRDLFDRGSLYSIIVRKYLDFYPYLKVQREKMKERLLRGSN